MHILKLQLFFFCLENPTLSNSFILLWLKRNAKIAYEMKEMSKKIHKLLLKEVSVNKSL